uniref:Solute carrier family 25 member 46 n=1 Tax=Graphocephala atropunctata TaxID=36148 RepID=A0A1B6LDV1_9HEMI
MEPLSLTKIKNQCCRCMQFCKSFMTVHQVEIIMYTADILVSHPFIVLRRQCQVRSDSEEYHITPLSLMPIVATLVHRKGFKVLFKGLFSIMVLRGVQLGIEQILSRLTSWPSKLPPTWYINKDWLLHFLLKSSTFIITAPIYSASVINTVAVSGDFTSRKFLTFQKYDYPLSFWHTMFQTALFGIVKYAFRQATLSLIAAMLYLNHCFDETERDACQSVEGGIRLQDRQDIFLKASVMSYLSAEILFYPLETVVHRLILQGTRTFTNDLDCGSAVVQILSAHNGFVDCYDNITWLEGKLGLYKGFGALLMQAFLYHYCIKFVSFVWHYIKKYKKTFS